MQHEATIIEKSNQLLVELRENPDLAIDEKISIKVISKRWSEFYMVYQL